jgi:ribosomal protein S18 acetylase RimI-like enzyme
MMNSSYQVENTNKSDLPFIFGFFDHSVKYQKAGGYPSWENYDKNILIQESEKGNQYKVTFGKEIGIVFSVVYSDKILWGEQDKGDAIYLHRIVVNPEFKGRKLFGLILNWSIAHAKQKGLQFVRMDTWANNLVIMDYYKSFGFRFMGNVDTSGNLELPEHNRNLVLALLEYKIE